MTKYLVFTYRNSVLGLSPTFFSRRVYEGHKSPRNTIRIKFSRPILQFFYRFINVVGLYRNDFRIRCSMPIAADVGISYSNVWNSKYVFWSTFFTLTFRKSIEAVRWEKKSDHVKKRPDGKNANLLLFYRRVRHTVCSDLSQLLRIK